MRRQPNTAGGGSRTNENGLSFEGRTDLLESFHNHPDFDVRENQVFQNISKCMEREVPLQMESSVIRYRRVIKIIMILFTGMVIQLV